MADHLAWTVTIGEVEQPVPPSGEWDEVVRHAVSGNWGTVTARRVGSTEKLILRFDEQYGSLEHWASDDGPVSGAKFPHRIPVTETVVELPCCDCGIALEAPDEYVLRKADAARLFLQFLATGEFPGDLTEPPKAADQPVLPGLEAYIVLPYDLNAVSWHPL